MKAIEIRNKYLKFFENHGHKVIPSSPLIPENDSSVLFTTAGMQPLVPYLLGEKHPEGKRLTDYQKCLRTNDIDEVGDNRHLTYFEMLGNWSLGDYFKEESIQMSYDFLTKELGIPAEKISVTCFAGDEDCPRDELTASCWEKAGIPKDRIYFYGKDDNWWIAGEEGPCGPDTEMFYDTGKPKCSDDCQPSCDCGKYVEIWNNVFMEYYKKDGKYTKLEQKNVDTGMGVERVTAILEGVNDNYLSSIWKDVIKVIEDVSFLPYKGNEKSMRIIADHIRTSVFISADYAGIKPSNTDQGYILRRLIRRAIRHAKKLNIDINSDWEQLIAKKIIDKYKKYYHELEDNENTVLEVLKNEKNKFNKTLEKGLKEFSKIVSNNKEIDGLTAFHLYDTYGFPIELTVELAKEHGLKVDEEGFLENFKKHQELSRNSSGAKFKGGLAGNSEIETRYHTATHLLNAALKEVVSKDIHQRGSNITVERMRFDFNCDHKLTEEEKQKVENLVNKWIAEDLEVKCIEMTKEEALASGAECMFIDKYPDIVTVYEIGNVSKELCGGPHVKNTKEIGKFKIVKEEASSAGVRRIKAVIE